MKRLFCIVIFAATVLFISEPGVAITTSKSERSRSIEGNVRIDLERESIAAKLNYAYSPIDSDENSMSFFLNKGLKVSSLKCSICESFDFDQSAKPLPTLTVRFSRHLKQGEWTKIEISYSGSLSEMYNREERFLELGIDFFWYPVHSRIGEFNFTYKIDIDATPNSFILASNGIAERDKRLWHLTSRRPDLDINIVMGERLSVRSYKENGYNIQIVSRGMSDELTTALLKDKISTLEFYNTTFGIDDPQKEFTAVYRPFSSDLGYFRKGYFVLSQPKSAESIYFSVAHELAHHWWSNAGQKDAWLNESFAEYTAMMAVRELRSADRFDEMIEKKKADNKGLPPIYGFDRRVNREQTPLVLYTKGALKLHELEKRIGPKKFGQFLRAAARERVAETDRLIDILAGVTSPKEAEAFLEALKQ
jgi:hypothetical protein